MPLAVPRFFGWTTRLSARTDPSCSLHQFRWSAATTAQTLLHVATSTARCSACSSSEGPRWSAQNCFGTAMPFRVVVRLVRRRPSPAANSTAQQFSRLLMTRRPLPRGKSFTRSRARVCTHKPHAAQVNSAETEPTNADSHKCGGIAEFALVANPELLLQRSPTTFGKGDPVSSGTPHRGCSDLWQTRLTAPSRRAFGFPRLLVIAAASYC